MVEVVVELFIKPIVLIVAGLLAIKFILKINI